ncbi:MAG TPA: hypothetical protein PK604_10760 [Acetivibrio clariflavus]|nr:hypothetical protein [Acetivibrio clariflavus]
MKKRISLRTFTAKLTDNRGEFGVKQIAGTVAIVIIIGLIVQFMAGGWLTDRVQDVWTWLWEDVIKSWF